MKNDKSGGIPDEKGNAFQPRDPLVWALEMAGMLPPPQAESREEVMEAKIEALRQCIVELREQVDALLWLTSSGRVN